MTNEKWPPLDPGTKVKTYKPNTEKRREWTDEGWAGRRWGVPGAIIGHHDSHGLYYDVQHEDGWVAGYDPSEFDVVPATKEGKVIMPEMMPEIIWTDAVFYDGQRRLGRVVRCPEAGDLVFEVEHGHDAMMQKIWKRSVDGAFREFLIHCGNVLALAQKK